MPINSNPLSPAAQRRHDLDWLRVAAFGLLIFYHVGMFYVTWDWHVKSPHAGTLLQPVMALLNPWRLLLLFLISGVALRYAMDKVPMRRFLPARSARLLIPLAFGFFVFVAPQAYYELLFKGEIGPDFGAFYADYLDLDFEFSILTPTYNHLWYLLYILVYTLLIAALRPILRRLDGPAERAFGWMVTQPFAWPLLAVPASLLVVFSVTLGPWFPVTHALVDDWYTHAVSFTALLIGYVAAKSATFWRAVDRSLGLVGALAIAGGVALLVVRSGGGELSWLRDLVEPVYAWSVILSLLALAQRTCNVSHPLLRYLNAAVFPYYVLHQTLIVCLGAWAIQAELPLGGEVALVVGGTLLGCGLGYELIRRVPVLRPLFGLPWRIERGTAKIDVPRTA